MSKVTLFKSLKVGDQFKVNGLSDRIYVKTTDTGAIRKAADEEIPVDPNEAVILVQEAKSLWEEE